MAFRVRFLVLCLAVLLLPFRGFAASEALGRPQAMSAMATSTSDDAMMREMRMQQPDAASQDGIEAKSAAAGNGCTIQMACCIAITPPAAVDCLPVALSQALPSGPLLLARERPLPVPDKPPRA